MLSEITYAALASQTAFIITFPFIEEDEINLTIDGAVETDFTIAGTTLTLGGSVGVLLGGELVRLYRVTPNTDALLYTDFVGLTIFDETSLDRDQKQLLHLIQEHLDAAGKVHTGSVDYDGISFDLDTSSTWTETSARKMTPGTLEQYNPNGVFPVAKSGNDIVFPAGTYEVRVEFIMANTGGVNADGALALTDDENSGSQVVHFKTPDFEFFPAIASNTVQTATVAFTKTITFTHGDKLALRARNNAASGTVLSLEPSRLTFRRL